jgi:hypothetical protein
MEITKWVCGEWGRNGARSEYVLMAVTMMNAEYDAV